MRVMSTLLGWTWDQWAIAAGHYGAPPDVSWESALDLQKRWRLQYTTDPGAIAFEGITPNRDHEFAVALFSIAP